jgi:hypothetical protein
MRNLKNAISTLGVNQFSFSSNISSKAARNGTGIVFHRSNCGYPNVRLYFWGGEWYQSCGSHLLGDTHYFFGRYTSDKNIFPACEQGLSAADIIWFGNKNYDDPNFIIDTVRNKMSNTAGIDWNWSEDDLARFKINANKRNNGEDKYICNSSGFSLNPNYKD